MTNEIATLPAEVAAAIEALRNAEYTDYGIVTLSCKPGSSRHGLVLEKWTHIQPGENPQMLLDALVNGYQIEATPEQKVRKYFDDLNDKFSEANVNNKSEDMLRLVDRINTVIDTLDLLALKIEGVNAEPKEDE